MPGTLYLVGTPIGNLGDITARALETLKSAQIIAAEDTRRTRALLSHFEIRSKRLISVHAHVGEATLHGLAEELASGASVAFVTDAGMPSVSDPGRALVGAAENAGVPVVVIPGPSAVTSAAALSGLVEGPFWFVGFLPRQGKRRAELLGRVAAFRDPVLLFEAPGRLAVTLRDLAERAPERAACVCREMTKLHEQRHRGTLAQLASEQHEWRGESVLVIGPAAESTEEPELDESALEERIEQLLAAGASTKDAVASLGDVPGISRRELYQRVQAARDRESEGGSEDT